MPKTVLLIDGTAHLYRAFYAIRPLTDPQGRPVNAIYGFAQILLNLSESLAPDYVVVAFDTATPTHRHAAYAAYKAHRQAMPEDLQAQVPRVKELARACGFTLVELAGQEADDLIATLTRRARKKKFEVRIFTTDKDAFQLVGPGVRVLRPVHGGKGEIETLDPAGVERVFGVPPEQVTDVLALMGDASDHVPGVPGVGEKTALDLVRRFGSVEKLYARLDEVGQEKLRERLRAHREQAELSKRLVTLENTVELDLDWEDARRPEVLPPQALALLTELGFKSLLARRQADAPATAASWTEGLGADADPAAVLAEAERTGILAVEALPEGVALAAGPREAAWLPHGPGGITALLAKGGAWVDLVCDPRAAKLGFDLKPLAVGLLRTGRELKGELTDLHLMAHLLDLPADSPAEFFARVLGGAPPADRRALFACADQMAARALAARLRSENVETVYRDLELPLLPVLARMEAAGVGLDVPAIQDMSVRLGLQLSSLEKQVYAAAGVEFNVRSTQQLASVLFDRLKLGGDRRTRTGRGTGVEVLEALAAEHPLPGLVLEYRQLQKLKSTYLDVLPGLVDPRDGRVHTTFHQVGAATGRLSSSDPNLQNIPVRTELGRELRRAFVPVTPGDRLLSADYSQIELRLLAHLSGDERMLADFASGTDIHRATAAEIFQVAPEAVTPEMRRQAKTCNFGIAYGVSPYGLARQLGVSPAVGRSFIDHFFARYPGVRAYLDRTLEVARREGAVTTLLGRRRAVPDIASANRPVREAAERMAINAPLQGSAADLIKLAMVRMDRELSRRVFRSRMILQVHDELVFEGPEEEMKPLAVLTREVMGGVADLRVDLVVDAAWGRNWLEAHA